MGPGVERTLNPPVGCDWDTHEGRAMSSSDKRGMGEDVRVLQMLSDRNEVSRTTMLTLI